MGRDLRIRLDKNEDGLIKIHNILHGANLYGVNIIILDEIDGADIIIKHDNVNSPLIYGRKEVIEDLCHASKSSRIPCRFIEENPYPNITIVLPHLPEEDLDGINPTMCLENEIQFLEVVLTRYLRKWNH